MQEVRHLINNMTREQVDIVQKMVSERYEFLTIVEEVAFQINPSYG